MNNTLLYVITVLIWGSTWFAIEFQLGVVPPEVSIVYRYAGASVLLFAWSGMRGLRLRFDRQAHGWFMVLGLFLFCLNYIFAYRAQIHITSAMCAIAFTAIVWLNILLARLFFGIRAGARVLTGAAIGIVGIIVLFAPRIGEVSLEDGVLFGSLLAVCGAFAASLGNMASQKAQSLQLPVIQSNAWGMLYGAIFTATISAVEGHAFTFEATAGYVISLLYLMIFGSIIAFGAYLTLLGRIGAHKAGYAMVLFPVVALLLSILFEGLKLDLPILAGTALVLAGNVFVLAGRPRMPRNPATPEHVILEGNE
ncbi:MAG TPA: EamA family transporter [Woeseiaceae bacterium]|nr:EamA family transporter [Woeseiaceae bacterium]